MVTPEDFVHLKERMRIQYDSIISPVNCRCLNLAVYFNSKGFHHLLYNGLGKARSREEAAVRLTLIPLIVPVIKNTDSFSYKKIHVHKDRKNSSPDVEVEMWGIEAVVGQSLSLVRVVLKRTDGKRTIFWSVMRIK